MNVCDQLDDFLDGEYCPEFVAHLDDCDACRLAVDQYRRIGSVLVTQRPPSNLTGRIRRRVVVRQVRRLAIAASIIGAVGISAWSMNRPRPQGLPIEVVNAQSTEPNVRVRFPKDVIALKEVSQSPNVTAFWVYHSANSGKQERVRQ